MPHILGLREVPEEVMNRKKSNTYFRENGTQIMDLLERSDLCGQNHDHFW